MIKFHKPQVKKNEICFKVEIKSNILQETFIIKHTYRDSRFELAACVESIIAPFATIAVCNNLKIVTECEVDKLFVENLKKMPDILRKFDPDIFEDFSYEFPIAEKLSSNNNSAISTISGGIDSTFTMYQVGQELTHLIYVIGFDIRKHLSVKSWIDQVINHCRSLIRNYFPGKEIIICESNLQEVMLKLGKKGFKGTVWATHTVGASLASIIYPLHKYFGKLFIPGDGLGTYELNEASGKLFDHLFTSNLLTVINHDNNKTRIEKLEYISQQDKSILSKLRYCIKFGPQGGLNCGKCPKCVRTMYLGYLLGIHKYMSGCLEYNNITDFYKKHYDLVRRNCRGIYLNYTSDYISNNKLDERLLKEPDHKLAD